jgi:hypothetical protein
MHAMHDIIWPKRFTPGTTDNFASNEIYVAGLSAAEIWPCLTDTSVWPSYYDNAKDITFHSGAGPVLRRGTRFRFTTFGIAIESEVTECDPPTPGQAARLAWHGWTESPPEDLLDVHHAWLLEDLPGNRVRILTQESQLGQPAKHMARQQPNPMINAHQNWLDGLARAASTGR